VVPSKLYGVKKTSSPVLFIGPPNSDTAIEIRRHGNGSTLPNGCGGAKVHAEINRLLFEDSPRVVKKETEDGEKLIASYISS
ncbi:MAG: hypothetical protein RI519_07150, partial [Balneolaceae bacterium]|nr:hypothetical protein [Balneolaceae bacterium]